MAHAEQIQFIRTISNVILQGFNAPNIIEIGSYDVNGSVRRLFKNCNIYIGVDLIKGPGVDVVAEGHDLNFVDEAYDLSMSCECFEHNPHWIKTFKNMHRITKDGGVLLLTCATTGRLEHGTARTSPFLSPGSSAMGWNYYKNLTQQDFESNFNMGELFGFYFFLVNEYSKDLYFFGIKGGGRNLFNINKNLIRQICIEDQNNLQSRAFSRKNRQKFIGHLPSQFAVIFSALRLLKYHLKKLFSGLCN